MLFFSDEVSGLTSFKYLISRVTSKRLKDLVNRRCRFPGVNFQKETEVEFGLGSIFVKSACSSLLTFSGLPRAQAEIEPSVDGSKRYYLSAVESRPPSRPFVPGRLRS